MAAINSIRHARRFDFFPTFSALAGIDEPLPPGVEGGSIAPLLHGATDAVKRSREEWVFHFPHYQGDTPHSAIRIGDFKLMVLYETGDRKLFDLSSDPGETRDLAGAMPERAEAMEQRLKTYLRAVDAALPATNPEYKGKPYNAKVNQGNRR